MMRALIIFAVLGLALADHRDMLLKMVNKKGFNKQGFNKQGSNKKRTTEHEFCETGELDLDLTVVYFCYWSDSAETVAINCDTENGWHIDPDDDDDLDGQQHTCFKEFVGDGDCNGLAVPGQSIMQEKYTCDYFDEMYQEYGEGICEGTKYLNLDSCCTGGKSECSWNDNYYDNGYYDKSDNYYYNKQGDDEFWENTCEKGMYHMNGKCNLCPSGTFSDGSQSKCNICPEGTYSSALSSKCYACPPGTYSVTKGSNTCQMCPVNTHSNDEGTRCVQCPPGYMAAPGSAMCKLCGGP